MNIITSLLQRLLLVGVLALPLTLSAATTDFAGCLSGGASIDNMEESIKRGITETVKIVEPVYDAKVKSYLRTYLERYPVYTEELLARAEFYFPIFEKYLEAYGLPTDLKYLAVVESGLRPDATSGVGAAGLWQFMRGTGYMFDLRITKYVDERRDPEKSTEAAVRYLKQLYEMLGSWELAMAGYNAGPGRVKYAMKRSGSNDYWKLMHYLPRETRSYVPGFIAANYLCANYEKHGLKPKGIYQDFGRTTVMKLYEGMSFQDINAATGVSLNTIKSLNPKYSRRYVPSNVIGYDVRLPEFALPLLIAHLGIAEDELDKYTSAPLPVIPVTEIEFEERTVYHDYYVRSGDNLWRIAQNNGCSVNALQRWNNLKSDKLRIGQRLRIEVHERVAVRKSPLRTIAEVPALDRRGDRITYAQHRTVDLTTPQITPVIDAIFPEYSVTLTRRMSVRTALLKLESAGLDTSSMDVNYTGSTPGYVVSLKK
jgi:LysM repeat protein